MWSRRGLGRVCASALLSAGLPWVNAQNKAPAKLLPTAGPTTVAVYDKTAFSNLPLTIAERLGYFAQEQLDVRVREYADLNLNLQAVLSGAAQVFCGPYSSSLLLHARGQQFPAFVLQGRAPQIVLGVSLRTMGHFRHLSELRGKRMGVVAMGSATHRMAQIVVESVGLQARDVQFVALPEAQQAVDAFQSGDVDALCYGDPVMTLLERDGDLRVVADARTVRGSAEVFGGAMPEGCLSAPMGFVKAQPQAVQAVTNAMVHALKWLQTAGPSDISKAVPESYFQGDRGIYLAAFSRAREAWAPDGLMPEDGPQTLARVLARFDDGAQLQRVDLAQTFTNEFARKAKALYKA